MREVRVGVFVPRLREFPMKQEAGSGNSQCSVATLGSNFFAIGGYDASSGSRTNVYRYGSSGGGGGGGTVGVPTLNEWGLIFFALLIVTRGVLILRANQRIGVVVKH